MKIAWSSRTEWRETMLHQHIRETFQFTFAVPIL